MKAKKWILAKQFSGQANDQNFELVEYDLPDELQPNGNQILFFLNYLIICKEVLCQAVYLSVDPYMR